MRSKTARFLTLLCICSATWGDESPDSPWFDPQWAETPYQVDDIQLGPRPYWLVNDMDESPLKNQLSSCDGKPLERSDFSISHRGAPLHFPEHTKESYEAAARMGAGVIECDVTFTKDKALVCRHSQCDLHTTTNILVTDLAEKCSVPFQPAVLDGDGNVVKAANARCCTSDITLEEFKSLRGKVDTYNPNAETVAEFLSRSANQSNGQLVSQGTLLSHKESIELFKSFGVKMTPELKAPNVSMPFNGLTQADYAQKMINEYREAKISPEDVYPQSFNLEDLRYWIAAEPKFARRAVYLDGRYESREFDHRDPDTWHPGMDGLANEGVNIIAPPLYMLIEREADYIVPSDYAKAAKTAGLNIIAWSLERSGPLESGGGFFYQSINSDNPHPTHPESNKRSIINNDGDVMNVLHVLAQDVGVLGVFSDWPATVTYYANCMR